MFRYVRSLRGIIRDEIYYLSAQENFISIPGAISFSKETQTKTF